MNKNGAEGKIRKEKEQNVMSTIKLQEKRLTKDGPWKGKENSRYLTQGVCEYPCESGVSEGDVCESVRESFYHHS